MKVIITNMEDVPLPMSNNAGWADVLLPDDAFYINDVDATVVVLGDKPSWLEQLGEDVRAMTRKILDKWHQRDDVTDSTPKVVDVVVVNEGANPLRVVLGANDMDAELLPGITAQYSALQWIELREQQEVGAPAHDPHVEGA